MTNDSEDLCSICHVDMNGCNQDSIYTIPDCGHKFHTGCIVNWFRVSDGSCPYCRQGAQNSNRFRSLGQQAEVIKLWKRLARRKDCPVAVKKLCTKIRRAKASVTQANKEDRELRRKHRDIVVSLSKSRRKKWANRSRQRQLERQLAALPPLPIIRFLQPGSS